jgi:hypothetical protein
MNRKTSKRSSVAQYYITGGQQQNLDSGKISQSIKCSKEYSKSSTGGDATQQQNKAVTAVGGCGQSLRLL